MENNKKMTTETTTNIEDKTLNTEDKKTKNISFKSSKDFTEEDIAKLPKVTVKIEKKESSKTKSVNYLIKFKLSCENGKYVIIQNYIDAVVVELVLHSWNKELDNHGIVYHTCSIRFSKGEKDNKEYKAYDLFLNKKRRIFDFLSDDVIEFLETFGFNEKFEDRVYFDEEGYKYEPVNF